VVDEEKERQAGVAYAEKRKGIIEYFPKNGIGAEIGILRGDFSSLILEITKPRLLCLVDPWIHTDEAGCAEANEGRRTQKQMDEIYECVKLKFENVGEVEILRMLSGIFFSLCAPGELDFCYIDGNHLFDAVMQDMEGAWKVVKSGGVIAGDDYGVVGWWKDGVTLAINHFCKIKNITPQIFDNQFLIQR